MATLSGVTDTELLARMPALVLAERARSADVIEHLIEIDRRRLFLDQACRSLSSYCEERLGYSEDEAGKRVRVARLASRFPGLIAELGAGVIHLTGLCLLAQYLTPENYEALVGDARGKSRRQIEELLAIRFPKPDVPERLCRVPEQTSALALVTPGASVAAGTAEAPKIRPGTDLVGQESQQPSRIQPLSASRWSVQFTASAELREKIERARELLSHAIPSGDLAALFERGLDELIARETKRRLGAERPRRRRALSPGSRHVPVEVARRVWKRDGGQCTFVDAQGRRCSSRRFLTIEHCQPYALGGPPTVENTCLLCCAHNQHAARRVFGDAHIEAKRAERLRTAEPEQDKSSAFQSAHQALRNMGFRELEVRRALARLAQQGVAGELEPLLRAALLLLVPDAGASVATVAGS